MVWERAGDVHVTLLGANPPADVLALAGRRVSVPGYVRDVEPYFLNARVFVAPIRYGAGVKGKIGHALSYRVPLVTTPLAADGFRLTDGSDRRECRGFRSGDRRLIYGRRTLERRFSAILQTTGDF